MRSSVKFFLASDTLKGAESFPLCQHRLERLQEANPCHTQRAGWVQQRRGQPPPGQAPAAGLDGSKRAGPAAGHSLHLELNFKAEMTLKDEIFQREDATGCEEKDLIPMLNPSKQYTAHLGLKPKLRSPPAHTVHSRAANIVLFFPFFFCLGAALPQPRGSPGTALRHRGDTPMAPAGPGPRGGAGGGDGAASPAG